MSLFIGHSFVLTDGNGNQINASDASTPIRYSCSSSVVIDKGGVAIGDGLNLLTATVEDLTLPVGLSGANPFLAVPNRTYAWKVTVPSAVDSPITVNNLAVLLTSSFGAGSHVGVALYDSAGTTRLIDSGPLDGTVLGIRNTAQAAVVLNPGTFWLAMNFSATSGSYFTVQRHISRCLSVLNAQRPQDLGVTASRMVIASNASAGGQCPATLGTLTSPQLTGNDAALPPWVLLQP